MCRDPMLILTGSHQVITPGQKTTQRSDDVLALVLLQLLVGVKLNRVLSLGYVRYSGESIEK